MSGSQDHIARSIKELPRYSAPEYVWNRIEQELQNEAGKSFLDQAVKSGTAQKAPPEVWDRIEGDLDEFQNEEILKRAIGELPQYDAPVSFEELNSWQKLVTRRTNVYRWMSVAASIVLTLSIAWYLSYNQADSTVQLSHSQQVIYEFDQVNLALEQLDVDDEIAAIIEDHCTRFVVQCESPEFKGLFDYYVELDASKTELVQAMQENSDQVQLVEYLVRVEKEKDEIGRQLIQLIIAG